jgi:hypothetical protein
MPGRPCRTISLRAQAGIGATPVLEEVSEDETRIRPLPRKAPSARPTHQEMSRNVGVYFPFSCWSAKQVRDFYGLRTDIEERHRQLKCFWDLSRFHSTAWSLVVSHLVFVSLTYSLLQLHLLQQGHQALNRCTPETTRRLLPDGDRVIIYRQQYFGFFTLLEHTQLMLSLEGKARRKALAKARRLQKEEVPSHA